MLKAPGVNEIGPHLGKRECDAVQRVKRYRMPGSLSGLELMDNG